MADTYITVSGDTWDGIAYKVFTDENYMDRIMSLNPAYRETVIFPSGIELLMPERTVDVDDSLPPWKREEF